MSGFGLFLGNYIRPALVYRWIVLVPTVVVFALVTMYVTMQPDTYESSAILMKPLENPADGAMRADMNAIARDMFRSAADRLSSKKVLQQVVERCDPYPSLRQTKGHDAVVERLRRKLRVDINRTSGTITVTCSHNSGDNPAETATAVVNTLTDIFVRTQRKAIEDQIAKHKMFLDQEKKRTRANVDKSLQALDEFKAAHRNALPEDRATNNARIDRLTRDVQDYKSQQRTHEAGIARMHREVAQMDLQLDALRLQNQTAIKSALEASERGIATLQVELRILMDTYAKDHEQVVAMNRKIQHWREINSMLIKGGTRASTKRAEDYLGYMMDGTKTTIENSQREIDELELRIIATGKKVEEARKRIFNSAQSESHYLSLQRAATEAENRYNSVVARHAVADQRARLDDQFSVAPIQVEQAAYVPAKPASPDRLVNSLMGLLLGLGLGVGLAIARQKLDRACHRPDDLRALLPGAVLVTVPEVYKKGARLGTLFISVLGGLVLTGIFSVTVAILGVQIGWWGEPEMVRALINLR